MLTVGEQTSSVTKCHVFQPPETSSILNSNIALRSSPSMLVIFGWNYGFVSLSCSIRLGETACVNTQWISDSSLSCRPARGYSEPTEHLPAILSMGGQDRVHTMSSFFSYDTLECSAGAYLSDDEKECVLCGTATYSVTPGATQASTCKGCPENSNSPLGSSVATACTCNAGFSGPNGFACIQCVAGKYKNATGDAACIHCLAGQYSTTCGATSNMCQGCPTNSNAPEASDEQTDCVCKAGSTGLDGNPCTECVAGKYKIALGDAACSNCLVGKYSTAVGAKSNVCQGCPPNSDAPEASDEQTDCTCNAGFSGSTGGTCSQYFVDFVVNLPYTSESFEQVREDFLQVVTWVAIVERDRIVDMDVSEQTTLPGRRLFIATSIHVSLRIRVDSLAEGERVVGRLSRYFLNLELVKLGIKPIADFVSGPESVVKSNSTTVTKADDDGRVGFSWILIVAIGAGIFVVWSSLYLIYESKQFVAAPENNEEMGLAAAAAEKAKLQNILRAAAVRYVRCGVWCSVSVLACVANMVQCVAAFCSVLPVIPLNISDPLSTLNGHLCCVFSHTHTQTHARTHTRARAGLKHCEMSPQGSSLKLWHGSWKI